MGPRYARKAKCVVVLLGSSRMLIEKGLTESLAGRYELIRLTHWTFPEMKECFGWNLYQYVYFGGYPDFMLVVLMNVVGETTSKTH